MHAPLATEKARFTDPHVKAYALLQAHFSRTPLSADMAADQRTVLLKATRLLQVQPHKNEKKKEEKKKFQPAWLMRCLGVTWASCSQPAALPRHTYTLG